MLREVSEMLRNAAICFETGQKAARLRKHHKFSQNKRIIAFFENYEMTRTPK